MVQIDAVVCAPEKVKLISKQPPNSDAEDNQLLLKNENRFTIVSPHKSSPCDNCLFYTFNLVLKRPVASFCLFVLFLISFVFLGPVLRYAKCALLPVFDGEHDTPNKCTTEFSDYFDKLFSLKKTSIIINDLNTGFRIPQGFIADSDPSLPDCFLINQLPEKGFSRCFYSLHTRSYKFINVSTTDQGAVAYLKIIFNSTYPKNIPILKMELNYRTEDTLRVKIYDPVESRYEPPFPEITPMEKSAAKNTKYFVAINKDKLGFSIVRKSNNRVIFDTQDVGKFIFSDQLLQLSARLPQSQLYGLGQQRNNFLLDTNWTKITLFNHDQPPKDGNNLYGSHPFYLAMEEDGLSNGVLLLNSNAMDVELSPGPVVTYRTIGGIFDFYVFLGPSPAEVVRQYTELVGRPFLPPFWSLGFHLCRFGYKSAAETYEVWNRTREAKIPFDTQWNDIDYMDNRNDFTYDKERFADLPDFVDVVHSKGMHYMVILDPGISSGEAPGSYPPFDQGMAQQIFINDETGYRPFQGKVWNKKSTVFVDFFKPAAVGYWLEQLRVLHEAVDFDGAWIDMNDPSNFFNGTLHGCPRSSLDDPPYVPSVQGGRLSYRTLCMSARHYKNESHYNLHNAYGLAEAIVTNFAMQQIRAKRAFVISRSSFPGHGRYAGVWSGDISSTWDDMSHSISDIMSFSLFGIPMSGADICGFNGNATVELCQRWSQLGAFYPFSRNHNSDQSSDQDPVAMGPAVVDSARKALLIRYSLLPYLYTLFWHAHNNGDTVARPLFFEFPNDNKTYAVNSQFLWGPALMVAPVLKKGALNVTVYLPEGSWFDFYSYKQIDGPGSRVLPAPLDTIPLLLRGGFIIPTQLPELTTTRSRLNPIDLIVSLDTKGSATGDFYWDDGDTLDHNDGLYNLVNFTSTKRKLVSRVEHWRFTSQLWLILGDVRIIGVDVVREVTFNGNKVTFDYHPDTKMLLVKHCFADLSKNFEMTWK